MSTYEIHYDPNGSWAALYVNGQLERVGDSYLAEELAFERLGVKIVHDNSFLRGQSAASGAAHTLNELAEYVARRDAVVAKATELRQRAAALLEEAQQLDRESRDLR